MMVTSTYFCIFVPPFWNNIKFNMCHYVSSFFLALPLSDSQWSALTFHGVNKSYTYTTSFPQSKQNHMGFTAGKAKQSDVSMTHPRYIRLWWEWAIVRWAEFFGKSRKGKSSPCLVSRSSCCCLPSVILLPIPPCWAPNVMFSLFYMNFWLCVFLTIFVMKFVFSENDKKKKQQLATQL